MSTRYIVEYAKRKANCKKCKQPIEKGSIRMAKCTPNFFNDGEGEMKMYHHVKCMFEVFSKMRATTKKPEHVSEIEGFSDISDEDKATISQLLNEMLNSKKGKSANGGAKKAASAKRKSEPTTPVKPKKVAKVETPQKPIKKEVKPTKEKLLTESEVSVSRDDKFREFRRLCGKVANESSYNAKTQIFKDFFTKGSSKNGYDGNVNTMVKLLIPGSIKRVYNLQNRQLVKIFSQVFLSDLDEMMTDLEQGDVSETVAKYFAESIKCSPQAKSIITIQQVDSWLDALSKLTREEDQTKIIRKIAKRCTVNDLQTIIRLIKSDLRIQAGPKHVLDAFHSDAYEAFKASKDLDDVLKRIRNSKITGKKFEVVATLMTPVAPMLAEPCKSVEQAMKKCKNGMYSEIKYDGERVQLHKKGNSFNFYSRSLKPVKKDKIECFEKLMPKAFPHGDSAILDSEVLLIDPKTGVPLPFGTLGVHKRSQFKNANVCLFVFDILHFNGENLMSKSMNERRKILAKSMVEIPNHIMLSEMKFVTKADDLKSMIAEVIQKGLEGLVLKDINGIYEPGKRHWLKVKKDYLLQGQMADSADLVVLGAYFGTGNKGGMMSVFLMGCYNKNLDCWHTVTKVGNGHDDSAIEEINKTLKVRKISKKYSEKPRWLRLNKQHTPDFVVEDPKQAPVWEITGAEYTKSEIHTADGISIRFPRVTRVRDDKNWETATSLEELRKLYEKSKEETDVSAILGLSPKKIKKYSSSDFSFLNDKLAGAKVFVPQDVLQSKSWKRFIVSCNGELLQDHELEFATHCVKSASSKTLKLPKGIRFLTEKDLKL